MMSPNIPNTFCLRPSSEKKYSGRIAIIFKGQPMVKREPFVYTYIRMSPSLGRSWRMLCIWTPSHQLDEYDTRPFKVGPCAGSEPTQARHFQKCFGPRRHSPKERHLRCQAINLTPLKRRKAWGNGPEARGMSSEEAHQTRTVHLHTCADRLLATLTSIIIVWTVFQLNWKFNKLHLKNITVYGYIFQYYSFFNFLVFWFWK